MSSVPILHQLLKTLLQHETTISFSKLQVFILWPIIINKPGQLRQYSYWLQGGWPWFNSLQRHKFSLCCQIQADFRAHSDSYQMDTYCSFSTGNLAKAWSWPFITISYQGLECLESYVHSPIHFHWIATGYVTLIITEN